MSGEPKRTAPIILLAKMRCAVALCLIFFLAQNNLKSLNTILADPTAADLNGRQAGIGCSLRIFQVI